MDVEEAIRTRHSVKVFAADPVDSTLIAHCLDLAVWAPNHHLTEPWTFTVIQGTSLVQFSDVVYHILSVSRLGSDKALKEKRKLLSAPVLIAVYAHIDITSPKTTQENYASTAVAIQNILLVAHNLGLGAIWRTADTLDTLAVRSFLHVPDPSQPVGLIYLGYSAQRNLPRRRTPAEAKTEWLS